MASLDFYHAPTTKALFYGSALGTLVSSYFLKQPSTGYDVTAFSSLRVLKVLASQVVFGSVGEMMIGLGLLYQFRVFERRMGSSRFVSFTVFSTLLSLSLQMIFLVLFPGFDDRSLTRIAPGPYSILFALFVHYFAFIPKVQKHSLLGFDVSEKTFIYFLGSQLLFSRGKESMVAGVCGVIGGLLCLTNKLPFHHLRLPDPLQSFGKNVLAPMLDSRSTQEQRVHQERMTRLGATGHALQAQGIGQGERLIPNAAQMFAEAFQQQQQQMNRPQRRTEPPSEEHVATLTALGFTRDAAIRALRNNDNNVERAADSLLSQS